MSTKISTSIAVLFLFIPAMLISAAENPGDPLRIFPISAETAGRGGTSVSTSSGYTSMIYNPAGFAAEDKSFTLLSLNPWIYTGAADVVPLIRSYIDAVNGVFGFTDKVLSLTQSNGFGLGGSAGLGYVGSGLGLGIILTADSRFTGTAEAGISGYMLFSGSVIAGYTVDLELGGLKLNIGGNIRPTIMIDSETDNRESLNILESLSNLTMIPETIMDLEAGYSLEFPFDLGLIFNIGPFLSGISIRDTGNTRRFSENGLTIGDSFNRIVSGELPRMISGNKTTVPMSIIAGIGFHPAPGDLFSPVIQMDADIMHLVSSGFEDISGSLSFGVEVGVLNFLNIRAGFRNGRITGGAGIVIPGIELNCSLFYKEGDQIPFSGAAAEFALRF